MSRNFPVDTQIQEFLKESYNRERDTRLGWYFKNLERRGEQPASKQFEVFKKKLEQTAPKPTEDLLKLRDIKPKNYHKRRMRYDDQLPPLSEDSANAKVDMREVRPSRTKDLLYDGFTKEGKGRYQYLNERNHTIPEVKFRFPVLSSWEYGWRLGDVIRKEEIKKPEFGRTRIVADTFYTRTGIPQSAAF